MRGISRIIAALLTIGAATWTLAQEPFTLTVIHTNDLHAHVEPVKVGDKMLGGYARLASVVLSLRENAVNPIVLNAGDTFQGTLFFHEYDGLADLAILNLIGNQAAAVGNHEFDKGLAPLIEYARNARFPLLAANLDTSKLPELAAVVKKSTAIEVGGQRIGVIGCVPDELLSIIGPIQGLGVLDFDKSIQAEANALTKQGIDKIILLSHGGYSRELEFAKKAKNIDIVVGGHSHSLLGTFDMPGLEESRGPYPTVVTDADGHTTLVVQAWEWGKVVGNLAVTFDAKGRVESWKGEPVVVDETFPENPYVASLIEAFRKPIEALKSKPIAELKNDLTQRWSAEDGEGLMGNVIADAVLAKTQPLGAVAAFWNSGGVRGPLAAGTVSYGDLVSVTPFGNTLVVLELSGTELMAAIEEGLLNGGMLLPSKGFSYTFDPSAPPGSRLKSASLNGDAIAPNRIYKVALSNFTAEGGDNHLVLKNAKGTRIDTGFIDLDALIEYMRKNSPLTAKPEGRIKTTR